MSAIYLKDIELKDKNIFDGFFKSGKYDNSECAFTYWYMWRKGENVKWAIVDDCLCIINALRQPYCYPPYGATAQNFANVLAEIEKYFANMGQPFWMKAITQQYTELFQQVTPLEFSLKANRNAFDYIYSGCDLRELNGRKFSNKRNHIHAFMQEHAKYNYIPITQDVMKECRHFIANWFDIHVKSHSLLKEREAILEIMKAWDDLDVKGAVIEIDGKIEALTLGEAINCTTTVIHVEKANSEIRGLYQVINQEFCRREWADKLYINREEDMGIAGLRKAKQSYFPLYLLEKYEAVRDSV